MHIYIYTHIYSSTYSTYTCGQINGNSAGMGAFSVFGDSSLHDTASMLVHFALGIPWTQLMSFPKVCEYVCM